MIFFFFLFFLLQQDSGQSVALKSLSPVCNRNLRQPQFFCRGSVFLSCDTLCRMALIKMTEGGRVNRSRHPPAAALMFGKWSEIINKLWSLVDVSPRVT